MSRETNQLTLSFLDTTSLSAGGLTLDAGCSGPRTPSSPQESIDDESTLVSPSTPAIPARNFHLAGDRRLARGWKARAADNLASMRLALQIEEEKRNATPDEQEILCRFTGFGASERKRGKFPGERRWIYAGAGRMRLARGGIFGPGMPRRAPMNS